MHSLDLTEGVGDLPGCKSDIFVAADLDTSISLRLLTKFDFGPTDSLSRCGAFDIRQPDRSRFGRLKASR